jgi:hypothetical protein
VALLVFKTSVGFNKALGGFDSHPPPPSSARLQERPVKMLVKVQQPPVDALKRDPEVHGYWSGCILIAVAIVLLGLGVTRPTSVETSEGESATSFQLTKGFARGGLTVQDSVAPPDPGMFTDPQAMAAALDRMAKERAAGPRMKYRVNLGAADPCPT